VVSRDEITRGKPAADLAEALDLVPGVFAQSGRNFAQDSRVSIRGFGARADFGIRGIRVFVDGIPATLPDGQSEVDSLELSFADRIEVTRGPLSSLYGGGGGGVISVSTLAPTEETRARVRALVGTDRLSRYEASVTGSAGETGIALGFASTRAAGFRDHARGEQQAVLAKLTRPISDRTEVSLRVSAVWAPEAQDPGGLSRAGVRANRSAALANARRFDAGEKLNQQRVSVGFRSALEGEAQLRGHVYRIWRDFSNALPFDRRVDFDRTVTGGALFYDGRAFDWRVLAGVELDVQQDRRRNYRNLNGARGPITLNQSEAVRSVGPFLQAERDLPAGFGIVAGARYDWTEFKAGDRFTADGSQSDSRRFRELSPHLGLRWGTSDALQLRLNASSAFEVPTTTELRTADGGGFDNAREAERAFGLELGAKGKLGEGLFYDAALFAIRIRDVLVPVQDDQGRPFFRNAGQVRRLGGELALSGALTSTLSFRASYTYADYRYQDFDPIDDTGVQRDFDGKREPNTPQHSVGAELRWQHPSGAFATLSLRHFSDIEVDDANRNESDGATLTDLRVGWTRRRGSLQIEPFAAVRNLSDADHDGTLRPNAALGRFYEPAPGTELIAGVELKF
jgi:iron complex outermembrane recepter protein